MDPRLTSEVSITDLFDQFIEASTMRNVLSIHHRILNYSDLNPCEFNIFFPKLKRAVMTNRVRKNWKAKALFSKIDKKAAHRCYSNTKAPTPTGVRLVDTNQSTSFYSQEGLDDSLSSNHTCYSNNALQHHNCLVIGSGPAGLRTAIELQLLGASRVVVVEKRSRFSRNNVLHLWPFVIDDLKSLGAKKFYGKFCAGSIDHISIRQLQLILLKICLMIGCDFRDSCSYLYLCPESIKQTRQIINGNIGDTKNTCDGSESTTSTTKCDFSLLDNSNSDNFVKVSYILTDDGEEKKLEGGNGQQELKHSDSRENEKKELDSLRSLKDPEESDIVKKEPDRSKIEDSMLLNVPNKAAENQVKRGENLHGARAHFKCNNIQEKELHSCEWDIIIGADGRRNTLSKFFPRKEFRGRLAIAITANFINRQTPTEAAVPEISGLSFIYNQDMFRALEYDTNIQLENICYYKDDTHYFVMTAKKKSLLEKGVLMNDYATTQDLLSDNNVDRQALLQYAKEAAFWTTGLNPLDFALNHYGQEDCAMFDFTSMYAASNACKALRTKEGGLTLVSLVGDSLLEPFWPTGSGCARGFLSSFDAAWMCRQWAVNKCAVVDYHNSISSRSSRNRLSATNGINKSIEPTTYNRMALSVMAERESIYRLLAQTTSENLQQNYSQWTLNPHTRYPNLNRHLVIPSQVEHLITDNDAKATNSSRKLPADTRRRIKSPINGSSRKSPKKLRSANASPLMQPKNLKGRSRSSSRQTYKSKSGQDLSTDDTYLEFEKSYNNLADYEKGPVQYLNHRRTDSGTYDYDLNIPSISGTMPSSNNLHSLEARRARDIDECLRQRRQKTQISVVRDQLIGQFRGDANRRRDSSGSPIVPGNAVLFNELRRLREQQASGKENKQVEVNGPLTLLNSMRRCASFAERVKNFESKFSLSGQESQVTTPKTPIENVKDLPQFATLQELFVNNSSNTNKDSAVKKTKIPIMKLSKDDWNVSCWEKRLAAYKQRNSIKEFKGSTKSLNTAISVDSYHSQKTKRPERQIEVFNDRIKEMADKLQKTRDQNYCESWIKENSNQTDRQKSWVGFLKKQLNNEAESKNRPEFIKRAMNPSDPNKPIKKLFEDDEEDEDGIESNKHYDHLCVNRPTNKYLPKNGYTSHLARTRYNSTTSKVINRQPDTASKQAYLNTLTSRGSSASSSVSDYSTNTGGSSSCSGKNKQNQVKCARCRETVSSADKINIGDSSLHRVCLTCANCSITLRTNEIQYYLGLIKESTVTDRDNQQNFFCAICMPKVKNNLIRETPGTLAHAREGTESSDTFVQSRIRSREEFLNERINYNELYKNILDSNNLRKNSHPESTSPGQTQVSNAELLAKEDDESKQRSNVTPSPIEVTLSMALVKGNKLREPSQESSESESREDDYTIARSETIDGSEQVTLVLPSETFDEHKDNSNEHKAPKRTMIDEDEFQRILHLDNSTCNIKGDFKQDRDDKKKGNSSSNSEHGADDTTSDDEEDNRNTRERQQAAANDLSDHSSSLNSPPNTDNDYDDNDDDDDDDDNVDHNSTYDDFLTSEEFGNTSEREDDGDDVQSNAGSHRNVDVQNVGVANAATAAANTS